jgi:hypothetical protein
MAQGGGIRGRVGGLMCGLRKNDSAKCLIFLDAAFQERFDRSFKNDSIWGFSLQERFDVLQILKSLTF